MNNLESFFNNKQVLVTGGAGFIGSHLSARLLELGAELILVDNFSTGRAANLDSIKTNPKLTVVEADCTTYPTTYLASNYQPDCVFHLASPASPPRYQDQPINTYLVNSWSVHQLLSWLKDHKNSARFLFASTSEVYGDPQQHPQTEGYWGNVNPNGPRSCYDEAKRLGETVCGVFHRDFNFDTRIVRIFNTYGPLMDPEDGRVVPNFILQALKNEPLTVYGDGSQTRSYCFVDDLVEGLLRMMASNQTSGETVNLGNSGEFTVMETAEAIGRSLGKELEFSYHPVPTDDPVKRKPDLSKAKTLLDWQPTVSFEDGLKPTIEYFRQFA